MDVRKEIIKLRTMQLKKPLMSSRHTLSIEETDQSSEKRRYTVWRKHNPVKITVIATCKNVRINPKNGMPTSLVDNDISVKTP